jgi:uncharacterized protein (DUF433 family)
MNTFNTDIGGSDPYFVGSGGPNKSIVAEAPPIACKMRRGEHALNAGKLASGREKTVHALKKLDFDASPLTFTSFIRNRIMDFSRIVIDPAICSGKPHIVGTRLTVDLLQAQLAIGWNRANILETYPYLTAEEVDQALAYKLP